MNDALACVAIVAVFTAARLVIDELDLRTGLAYYACWSAALAVLAVAWSRARPRLVPPRAVWTPATFAIAAGVVICADWLHGGRLALAIVGELAVHAPRDGQVAVTAIVLAPVVEEWLFRGVLWDALAPRMTTLGTLVATSLLFALWHVPVFEPAWTSPVGTPLWAHAAFGALAGVLRWRTRALAPGIAVHALVNATWLVTRP